MFNTWSLVDGLSYSPGGSGTHSKDLELTVGANVGTRSGVP